MKCLTVYSNGFCLDDLESKPSKPFQVNIISGISPVPQNFVVTMENLSPMLALSQKGVLDFLYPRTAQKPNGPDRNIRIACWGRAASKHPDYVVAFYYGETSRADTNTLDQGLVWRNAQG
jgi:hypothetical protein